MPTVTDTVVDAAGNVASGATITIELITSTPTSPAYVGSTDKTISFVKNLTTNSSGVWSASLTGNVDITPYGSYYKITTKLTGLSKKVQYIVVPSSGGPYWVGDLLTTPPTTGTYGSGRLITQLNYTSTVSMTVNSAWTAISALTISVSPTGRPIIVKLANGYTTHDTADGILYLDLYDVTSSPARAIPDGDTCTLSFPTASLGRSFVHEWGPFTPTSGDKTYRVYYYLASGTASMYAGNPVVFTASYSRTKLWAEER